MFVLPVTRGMIVLPAGLSVVGSVYTFYLIRSLFNSCKLLYLGLVTFGNWVPLRKAQIARNAVKLH